jgi:hypothetical protein
MAGGLRTDIGMVLLVAAFFLPWLSIPPAEFGAAPFNTTVGVPLSYLYVFALLRGVGILDGLVVIPGFLLASTLILYLLGVLASWFSYLRHKLSVIYPALVVLVAATPWLLGLWLAGLPIAPTAVPGPYVALAGAALLLLEKKSISLAQATS